MMPEPALPTLVQPTTATTYYVKHPENGWWGYFTVNETIGLLQILCDFGTYTQQFQDRWNAPGPDFKQFLIGLNRHYLANCLEGTANLYGGLETQKARGRFHQRVSTMITHLWPLFIDQLKVERQEVPHAQA